jgi:putative transposase
LTEVETKTAESTMIGLDMGVKVFASLSDGSFIAPLNSFKRHERKLRKLQRRLSRKKKKVLVKGKLVNGRNWSKAKCEVQKCQAIANVRRDFLHKTSTTIAKNHGVVVIEDLRVKNIFRSASGTLETPGKNVKAKSGLNKAILTRAEACFGAC